LSRHTAQSVDQYISSTTLPRRPASENGLPSRVRPSTAGAADGWARTAQRRLGEDAVSETVLAALAKPQSFGNRSQLKTWLVGILKHKVVDALRHHHREVSSLETSEDAQADPLELDPSPFTPTAISLKRRQTGAIRSNRPAANSFLPSSKPASTNYPPPRVACF
jgi:hypothetical protein